MKVLIGVDPHKSANAVAAIDEKRGDHQPHGFPGEPEGSTSARAMVEAVPRASLGG